MTENRPHDLPDDEQVGLLEPLERDERGGAVDHDDAREHEQQRRREHHSVSLELSCHLRQMPVVQVMGNGQNDFWLLPLTLVLHASSPTEILSTARNEGCTADRLRSRSREADLTGPPA